MNECLSDQALLLVAENIGTEQLSLGIKLGLSKSKIDIIKADHKPTVDATFAILETWKNKATETKSLKAKKEVLCEVLSQLKRNDIVLQLEDHLAQEQNDDCIEELKKLSIQSDEGLSIEDKKKIQRSFHDLKYGMKCDEVITKLFSSDVIGRPQKEKLDSMKTESEKADCILDLIMRGTYGKLHKLKTALKDTGQPNYAKLLP